MCPSYPLSKASRTKLAALDFRDHGHSLQFKNRVFIITVNDDGDFYVQHNHLYRKTGTADILSGSLEDDARYIKNAKDAGRIFDIIRADLSKQESAALELVAMLQNSILALP